MPGPLALIMPLIALAYIFCSAGVLTSSAQPSLPLEIGCKPLLGIEYQIKYYSGVVYCGNLLLESDIGGTHPWVPPKVLPRKLKTHGMTAS